MIIVVGSFVNKDIPDGSVAAGVPCRVIGKFENYMKRLRDLRWVECIRKY